MNLKNERRLRWYFRLYDFIAEKRKNQNDVDERDIHSLLVSMLTTGILMWGYAFVAYFTISSPVPGYVGFICSLTHTLSPLIFRLSSSRFFASNILIGSGLIHQATYSFYTGGFKSHLLIWFGILPMLGGVMSGVKGAITWTICTTFVSLSYLILHLYGFEFPDLISDSGRLLSHGMLVFGWIFLSSSIVIVYASLRAHTEKILLEQGKKIEDLFRVLFHDLANPLGRISIGLAMAKRSMPEVENNRGMGIAQSAADSMMEITQNVRKMYAVSKGKANVDLTMIPFMSSLEYIQRVFASELDKKKIKIKYNPQEIKGLSVLVEPVSFNNQVFGNIISNAIKFSPPGGTIQIETSQDGHENVVIAVKDNGIGMPEALMSQLFDVNKKTTRTGTTGETGTGFGMHIMKSFIELYNGEILVESTEKTNEGQTSGTTIKMILKGHYRK